MGRGVGKEQYFRFFELTWMSTMTQHRVRDLPLNGRNMLDLACRRLAFQALGLRTTSTAGPASSCTLQFPVPLGPVFRLGKYPQTEGHQNEA